MTPRGSRRWLPWLLLGVLVAGSAFLATRPTFLDWIRYRHVERVPGLDGGTSMEYVVPRWGGAAPRLRVFDPETRTTQEQVAAPGQQILIGTRRNEDGRYETFVFPGATSTPDLVGSGPPGFHEFGRLQEEKRRERDAAPGSR